MGFDFSEAIARRPGHRIEGKGVYDQQHAVPGAAHAPSFSKVDFIGLFRWWAHKGSNLGPAD
jgi:hypothetical protein